jgi:hypothetical protein
VSRQVRGTWALGALLVLLFLSPSRAAHSADLDVPALVAACTDGARLSPDNTVLCFDGEIGAQTSLDPFLALNGGGTLVVRSPGGLTILAMRMADILREKNARVVIHDYCLSACANALFVATHETHVAEGALLAWHGNTYGCEPLETLKRRADKATQQTIARYEELCGDRVPFYEFYRKRGISSDFTIRPQTAYSRTMFQIMQRRVSDKRSTFWTWHPDNFRDFFKSKIMFRSYPDQAAFEARLARFGSRSRVIYDPPGGGPTF